MKYIIFGGANADTGTVLDNLPYDVDYIVSNSVNCTEFAGKKIYSSYQLFSERYDDIYIFVSDISNYREIADQLVKMGFMEGKHFSGALEYLYNQWEKRGDLHDIYAVRVKNMSDYISHGSKSILDLGCGSQYLKNFLGDDVKYIGVDYLSRGDNTVICDFNKGEYPNETADTVFCSGCLEYIEDVNRFIRNICRSAVLEVIVSYCPLEYKNDIWERRRIGWKNHMTIGQLIKRFSYHGLHLSCSANSIGSNMIFRFVNRRKDIVHMVQENNLTYLEKDALEDLMEAVSKVEAGVEGDLIETGCALGGSGICMAYEKMTERKLVIYDVFGMIPAPGIKDGQDVLERYEVIREGKSQGIGGELYYGYQENLEGTVEKNFCSLLQIDDLKEKNISLVKGLFKDTLVCERPVALAHIDCDWYDSVMTCLERIVPHLAPGGILIVDDYYHWSGARDAVDDYFKDKKELFEFERKSRLHITKK